MADDVSFWQRARRDPARIAVVDTDGRPITAGELLDRSDRLALALRSSGLTTGDVVASLLPNSAAALTTYLAGSQVGLWTVPINTHLTLGEVGYIVADSGAKVFIGGQSLATTAAAAATEAALSLEMCWSFGAIAGFRPIEEVLQRQPAGAPTDRVGGFILNYTSGTTGSPKGVRREVIGHDPDLTAQFMTMLLGLFGIPTGEGVHLVTSPLYHTAVSGFALAMLHAGHQLVLMDKWEPEAMLRLVDQHQVTTTHVVPTMFRRLLRLPDSVRTSYDVSSLTHVVHTAAPCPVATKQAILEWVGPKVYEYYAATEGGGTLATPEQWLAKPGTVGQPWPLARVEVRDDDGRALPAGCAGKVWMSMGSRFAYHGDPEKTDSVWDGDFFTVGDIGYLDEDGFLFLCDREADVIIAGGVNIYPAEVEAVLGLHPAVEDVAVVGVPDDDLGEHVHAMIQCAEHDRDDTALAAELLQWCDGRLARYKWPRGMDFVTSLPRDPSGKLYRRRVREPYWAGSDRRI